MLYLFGAPRRKLPDGTYKRGDIHVLLIGDKATGKSQLLQYIYRNFKAVKTSGPGTTKVGLVAAAVKEKEEWTIQPGPLVLADNWICVIEEFDKMGSEDRSSLHEPMEQQEISISKAGLLANFKARCGILAAANPKYGRFDPYHDYTEQFNLPDTILSRFDLIFIFEDKPDEKKDDEIAEAILGEVDLKPGIDPACTRLLNISAPALC